MVNSFAIKTRWPKAVTGDDAVARSFAHVQIDISGRNVTRYEGEFDPAADEVQFPTYYLAEWFTENWWPILWEPRKSETEGDDYEFLTRHSTVFAQNGFALPKITFVQQGAQLNVHASARDLQHPEVRFRNGGNALLPRVSVEAELSNFVARVVKWIGRAALEGSNLIENWDAIRDTDPDEQIFCQLMGALGLSPYVTNKAAEELVERAVSGLGEDLALDLCLAAKPENLNQTLKAALLAHSNMVVRAEIGPLLTAGALADPVSLPGWRRGVQAARKARETLSIRDDDPEASNRLFERLKIDLDGSGMQGVAEDDAVVLGVVEREGKEVRFGLTQSTRAQRRFTAARAAFAAWTAELPTSAKFLTLAVTREQQASRAFAAEITAPIAYLRKRARGSKISDTSIFELAGELQVSAEVVRNQLVNNGLTLTRR